MDLVRVVERKSICDNEYYYSIYIERLFRIDLLSLNAVKLYFKENYNYDFRDYELGESIYVYKRR